MFDLDALRVHAAPLCQVCQSSTVQGGHIEVVHVGNEIKITAAFCQRHKPAPPAEIVVVHDLESELPEQTPEIPDPTGEVKNGIEQGGEGKAEKQEGSEEPISNSEVSDEHSSIRIEPVAADSTGDSSGAH